MPVQVQAALRTQEVQQLTSIASTGIEQLGKQLVTDSDEAHWHRKH